MIGATAAPLADGLNPMGDYSKMDNALRDSLSSSSEDEIVPVIFQLNSEVLEEDLSTLENYGATILGDAPLVDGGLIEASIRDIRVISTWDRVEYLELDRPLDFFYLPQEWGGEIKTDPGIMMHETTHVVKATDAWDRVIISPTGEIEYEVDQKFTEWDGDGTAIVDLDTGVDAGHPDFDYLEPWTGDKVIYSAKWDGVWTETTNSDTSSGHGTHVGGTIAGNGDASAGRRAGVAKGAQMVALGTGDGASIFAAEQGLARAQTSVGTMYDQGLGVTKNYKTAIKWYMLAAEQGNDRAQFNLGVSYLRGEGVIKDNIYAHMWANISASNGHEDAVRLRDFVEESMTPANISQAQKLARECVAKNYIDC